MMNNFQNNEDKSNNVNSENIYWHPSASIKPVRNFPNYGVDFEREREKRKHFWLNNMQKKLYSRGLRRKKDNENEEILRRKEAE